MHLNKLKSEPKTRVRHFPTPKRVYKKSGSDIHNGWPKVGYQLGNISLIIPVDDISSILDFVTHYSYNQLCMCTGAF